MSSKVGVECFGRFGPFFSVDGVDVSVEWATKMAGSTGCRVVGKGPKVGVK